MESPGQSAIYVRISHDPLSLRAGVGRQLEDCRAIVAARGWPEPRVYEDNDRSAISGRRPAWEQMIRDIPRLHAIVAWDMDRLCRQPRDLERLLDACSAAGLTRVVTAQGDIDLTSHDGQLQARILVAVAKKESDDKSRRVARAAKARGDSGRFHGGRIPYGYRRGPGRGELLVDLPAARDVRDTALALLDGTSIATITHEHLGVAGAPQSDSGWRNLLLSPTIAGRTITGRRADWPAILDDQLAADVRALLEDPSRLSHDGIAHAHWLSGMLVCSVCDGWMRHTIQRRAGKPPHARYRCTRCRTTTITAQRVEAFCEGAVLAAAPQTATVTRAPDPQPDLEVQARLDQLAVDYASGLITRSEWLAARESITHRTTPGAISDTTASTLLQPTAERWATWDATTRRRAARQVLRRIVVHPGQRGVGVIGERITFDWIA